MEREKWRYFGTDKVNGRECHLFGNVWPEEDKFGKTTTKTEIAVDAETGLPCQSRMHLDSEMESGKKKHRIVLSSTLFFDIKEVNLEFSDVDFRPKKEYQAVANEKPEAASSRVGCQTGRRQGKNAPYRLAPFSSPLASLAAC